MSGGAPGGGGHGHGLPHADDHGHFPEEELLKEVGSRSYKLKPYEEANLSEIERKLHSGEHLDHHELHEYQHYLEHMSHELKEVLQEEHHDHIHNLQLEKDLRRVAMLLQEVTAVMERHGH